MGTKRTAAGGTTAVIAGMAMAQKQLKRELGETEIRVLRDRNGEFEPRLIEKRQTCTEDLKNRMLTMYLKGMTTRDIEDHLRDIYGLDISASMISRIADKIMPAVAE